MNITMPSNLIVSDIILAHNTPAYYTESLNLGGRSIDRGIHRIEGSFNITTDSSANKRGLEAFLLRVRGRTNPFFLDLPDRFKSDTVLSTFVQANAAGTAGDNTISVDAFSGSIAAGDMFNLINDDKTYIALGDLTGAGTIDIFPPVRKSFVDNTQLDFLTTKILVRFREDIQSVNYTFGGLIHTSTFNWMEALS
jgi:hypothetical protein